MKTRIIEATNGFNWGKFLLGQLDDEWDAVSQVDQEYGRPLLASIGYWTRDPRLVWVLDLQTAEGAYFQTQGSATADLNKHKIWVCPMYEPFLCWLYKQHFTDIDELQPLVDLTGVPSALAGYRRLGPEGSTAMSGIPADQAPDQETA